MLQRLFFVSISVSALLLFARVAPTQALVTTSPISIHSCTVARWQRIHDRPYWAPFAPWRYGYGTPVTDGIQINYVNTSNKTADRVAFVVNYRGDIQHIVDEGTFSPGASISHTFGNYTGDAYIGPTPNSCRVRAVRFTDGTVWHAF